MGDTLRQLLCPLILPLIVAIVWISARVRQQDDVLARNVFAPAGGVEQVAQSATVTGPVSVSRSGAPAVGFFAASSAEEATEQP